MNIEVLQLRPNSDVFRQLLESVVGCLEAARVINEFLVLEDLFRQLLNQYRVEGHVKCLDVLLPAYHALGDVTTQLGRQSHHFAARSHRRNRLLSYLTRHRSFLHALLSQSTFRCIAAVQF